LLPHLLRGIHPPSLATPLSPLRGFKAKLVLALMAELLLLLDLFSVIIYLVPFKSSDKTTRFSCEVNTKKMREKENIKKLEPGFFPLSPVDCKKTLFKI
jgi:hypothetical protein